jgi:hypothetical protein
MTHSVAATSNAATPSETHRRSAARAARTSFAEVQAAAVKSKDNGKTTSADTKDASASSAPKSERTQKVDGHNYVEIISGPRNGMFINNTGEERDGKAFLIVKRHGREFHIYGSGDERKVFEVGRKRTTDGSATTEATGTTGTTEGTGTSGTGVSSSSASASTTA